MSMRRVTLLVLVVASAMSRPLLGQAHYYPACMDSAQTQSEMTQCAGESFKVVDRRLQQLVSELHDGLPVPQRAQLDSSQSAWVAYASVACRLQAAAFMGGTMYSMEVTLCRGSLATARIAQLTILLCDLGTPLEAPCVAAAQYESPAEASAGPE
jgi:uncharacterized protein YecT (DUF1311 family)